MTGGESKADHIFLRISLPLAKLPHSLTQGTEEFLFIYHALGCRIGRAETPRAD